MNDHPLDEQDPREQVLRAPDLQPSEEGVAASFRALGRTDAPEGVRRALLISSDETAGRATAGREAGSSLRLTSVRSWPLGGWGLASAALLLLSLGVATYVELMHPVPAPAPQMAAGAAGGEDVSELRIIEDRSMALFHAVETFDDVGMRPGRLIADWGR